MRPLDCRCWCYHSELQQSWTHGAFRLTFGTSWSHVRGHVAIARIRIPLFHARPVVVAHVLRAHFAKPCGQRIEFFANIQNANFRQTVLKTHGLNARFSQAPASYVFGKSYARGGRVHLYNYLS